MENACNRNSVEVLLLFLPKADSLPTSTVISDRYPDEKGDALDSKGQLVLQACIIFVRW